MISNDHSMVPALYGLVLAGGRSVRMGNDKSVMQWHGREQRYYMADLLRGVCEDVFISCRQEQQADIDDGYNTLVDNYPGAGPLIGILSAFRSVPQVAWLVTACDLPLLDMETLRYLVQHRDAAAMATTFKSPFDGLPEPLITIWEPSAYPRLEAHIADGFSCPRKALIRNEANVRILTPSDAGKLTNANTPEDAQKVKEILNSMGKPH